MTGADENVGGSVALPLAAAVDLCHALIADVAEAAAIRVLFIKGPTASFHELRPPRVSSDVDVFVEPNRLDALVDALLAHGWYRRPESDAHRYFVRHSVSLINSNWPNDIDIHTDYPGMFAPFPRAFERLWNNRVMLSLAARELPAAGRDHSFILGALHALRSMTDPRSIAELDHLHEWLAQARQSDARIPQSIADEVLALDAEEVLGPEFRGELDIKVPDVPSAEFAQWRIGTSQMNRTASWLQLIVDTPGVRDRARLVRQAAFPDRAALTIDHPSASLGISSLVSAYLARWVRAALAFPKASLTLARTGVTKASARVEDSVAPEALPGSSSVANTPEPVEAQTSENKDSGPAARSAWVANGDDLYVLETKGTVLAFHGYGCQLVWQLESEGRSTEETLARIHEESHMTVDECRSFLEQMRSTWDLAGVSTRPGSGRHQA